MGICFRKMIPKQSFGNDTSYSTPLNEKESCELSNHGSNYKSNETITSSSSFNDYIDEDDDDNALTYDLYDPSETLTTDFSSNTLTDIGTMKWSQELDISKDIRVNFNTQNIYTHKRYSSLTSPVEIKKDPVITNQPSYSPKILKSIVNPNMKPYFNREKSSSTSTLFMNNTIEAPDLQEILKCMSIVILCNIKKYENMKVKNIDEMFSEEYHPISKSFDYTKIPDEETIFNFLNSIYNVGQLSPECGIMAMAYIDRLLAFTGISFVSSTWRRIVLGCLILASKVWEELAVWNVDFVDVFSNLTVKDLNQLERQVLNGLQFNVTLKSSVYAKYYFEIRSFSKRDANNFPLKPLDKVGAKRMEDRSKGIEEKEKKRKMSRSKSAEHWVAPTVPLSLS